MKKDELLELPLATREAQFRSQTFDGEKNTVDLIWTTGADVSRRTWGGNKYIERLIVGDGNVRLGRLNSGAPLLDTHDDWGVSSVLGSVVPGTARLQDGKGYATVTLTRRPDAAGVVQDIKDGVLRNVSVGYGYHAVEKIEASADSPEIWRVTDWEPMEISIVPIGADAGAHVRSEKKQRSFLCVMTRDVEEETPPKTVLIAGARMRMLAREMGLAV